MNTKLLSPANLFVIAVIVLLGQYAIHGVKNYLSAKSTDDSATA